MGILLGLLSALAYGAGDFANGIAGRRADPAVTPALAQPFGLLAAVAGVIVAGGHPSAAAIAWGALSGVGNAFGGFALVAGLSRGSMGVVAPLSGVLAAALPVAVGVADGDHLSGLTAAGLVLALPAIALVAAGTGGAGGVRAGVGAGVVAGVGFGVFFVALDRAGTSAGAWPLVPGQAVAVLILVVLACWRRDRAAGSWRPSAPAAVWGGALSGAAALLYLAATGHGELAIVAVLASLYPAATVLLARIGLRERWSRVQAVGLGLSVVAVGAISAG